MVCMPHHYRSGGCTDALFTRDGQYVLTAGDGGILTCWKIKYVHVEIFLLLASIKLASTLYVCGFSPFLFSTDKFHFHIKTVTAIIVH